MSLSVCPPIYEIICLLSVSVFICLSDSRCLSLSGHLSVSVCWSTLSLCLYVFGSRSVDFCLSRPSVCNYASVCLPISEIICLLLSLYSFACLCLFLTVCMSLSVCPYFCLCLLVCQSLSAVFICLSLSVCQSLPVSRLLRSTCHRGLSTMTLYVCHSLFVFERSAIVARSLKYSMITYNCVIHKRYLKLERRHRH
jgi:hypothetical protein